MELSLSSSEFDAIERTAAHLKLATDSAEIGTWSLNIKTQKLEWSALHKRIWGYDEHRTDLVYEDWHKIILPADKETAFEKVEEARVKQTIYDVEYRINRANNSALRYIRSVGKYHYNDKGEAETLTGISIDVTEEKIAQEELTRAYEQIRLSKEAAELGMFDMDLINGDLIWDERCRQLFGISHKNAVTYENDFVRGLHPEDRAWVIKLIDDLFTLHDSNGDYDVEYRTVGVDDKKIRWVRAKGKVFYDSGHTPVRFIGSVLDISTNKNYQQELQIINEELAGSNDELRIANVQLNNLQKALQQSNINLIASNEKLGHALTTGMMGNWSINPADMSIFMSDYVKTLLGLPVSGNPTMELIMQAINKEFHQMVTDVLSDAINNGKDSDTEYSITNLITGEHKWVRATGKVFKDALGQVTEYSGLFMDITERKLDELRKNDFIGMVSHELKTPLTSLLPLIQLADIKLKNNPDKFLSEAMGRAIVQVKRMGAMIDGFLNVSRLEVGKISIIKQDFSIDELLKEVIREFELTISTHIIKLSNCDKIIINADKNKIASVITNLISNGIKYSPKGKYIIIKCKLKGNAVEISVKDEGIGIKATDKKKLFERYYRVEDSQSKYISGFGIGLYLSAEIVHRHRGEIWVESEIGLGSEFFFRLPIST